jgi:hypothetical protein
MDNLIIEKRKYDSDSTPEEIEMLKKRVCLLNEDTIYYNEVPVINTFQMDVMLPIIEELIDTNKSNYLLINLVDSKTPDAEQRDKLKTTLQPLSKHIAHAAVYTNKNKMNNIIAKFVLSGILENYSIHQTKEQALKKISDVKNR